eukprot:TRINITY_DN8974_c0_g1_i1.p1 TRINITY_DN8974_c0_g1~~TRINITY_DN8974_c0_g1_i1.p1  ORF type:complete len:413 (+),score=90.42 TRINITY_DN8974_c0_g1_i1:79-1317(+)
MPDSSSGYAKVPRELNLDPAVFFPTCRKFQSNVRRHAFIAWTVLPVGAALQWLIVSLRPTCEEGFENWLFIVLVGVVEIHHIYSENQAWHAFKSLLTQPEITVMRQIGILKSRRALVVEGILTEAAIFMNWIFPVFVVSCGVANGDEFLFWIKSWQTVPVWGELVTLVIEHVHFWGAVLFITALNWYSTGLKGMIKIQKDGILDFPNDESEKGMEDVPADVILEWAMAAETAMMPSLVKFCDAIARERRFVFREVDGEARAKAKRDAVFGKGTAEAGLDCEMVQVEFDKAFQERDARNFSGLNLLTVVLVKGFQIWLMTSYMMLTFHMTGRQAKGKAYLGVALNSVQMINQGLAFAAHRGLLGAVLGFFMFCFVAWSVANIAMAFSCEHHVWTVAKGCWDGTPPGLVKKPLF